MRKVEITLVDDLDGSEANETVTFALDGSRYEIDLNPRNASALRGIMATYTGAGRRLPGGGRRATRTAASASASTAPQQTPRRLRGTRARQLADIREWAAGKGIHVAERGRISEATMAQYVAERGGTEPAASGPESPGDGRSGDGRTVEPGSSPAVSEPQYAAGQTVKVPAPAKSRTRRNMRGGNGPSA